MCNMVEECPGLVEVIYMVPPRIQLFSAEEYTNRVNQVRELMALAGLDVLVILSLIHI